MGSEIPASFTNSIAAHVARTPPLLSNLPIFQSEQLTPAAGPTQRRLVGNCCVAKDYDGKPATERTIDPRDIELKPADQIWSAKAPLAGFASGQGMKIPPFSLHVLSWKVQYLVISRRLR